MTIQHILPAVVAAIFALSAVPAQAEMKSQWVEYSHGNTKLKAYMAYDDKITGRRPAVLVAHARSGMSPQTLKLTEIWAKLGYVSFAADIFGYGQGVLPKNTRGNGGADRDLQKEPRAAARTHPRRVRYAHQEPAGRRVQSRPRRSSASAAPSASSSARPRCCSWRTSRSTARSATMRPDGQRTPRACS